MKRFEVTREVEIRAIHHLENPQLTREENIKLYGICYGPHGHNYRVQVTIAGEMNAESGWLIDRDQFDRILHDTVVRPYDGRDLNKIFSNTACEALAEELYKLLKAGPLKDRLVRVGVQETPKNYFAFPADA